MFKKNGARYIQKKIDRAVAAGRHIVTIRGEYEIETTVLLPSDFTLILEDCYLRMKDGTFCNMFRNISAETCGEVRDYRISLRGVGRAILDGGAYNGLSERTSQKDGNPHISVNNTLLFANVDGFSVTNIHVRNQRWWALNFVACTNGYLGNIDFLAHYTLVNEKGEFLVGLGEREAPLPEGYDIYVKNADGIDLRAGCHDIIVENITGLTEDDTVAVTGLLGYNEQHYIKEGRSRDIYNITIRNINSAAYCATVRLLNQSGIKLYNVLVDGVMDASKDNPYLKRGGTGVRLGDIHLYGTRHATADETYNITIRNVFSRAGAVLRIAGAMKDCLFENIHRYDDEGDLIVDNAMVDISGFIR